MTMTMRVIQRRIAAPAPPVKAPRRQEGGLPDQVEQMCLDWGAWVASRRLLAPPPLRSVIGQLRTPASTSGGGGPNVRLSATLAAFNLALAAQPERAQAVIWAIYALPQIKRGRVHVKQIAEKLAISRATVYRLRDDAAQKAYAAHFGVLEQHELMMPSRVASGETTKPFHRETHSGENPG